MIVAMAQGKVCTYAHLAFAGSRRKPLTRSPYREAALASEPSAHLGAPYPAGVLQSIQFGASTPGRPAPRAVSGYIALTLDRGMVVQGRVRMSYRAENMRRMEMSANSTGVGGKRTVRLPAVRCDAGVSCRGGSAGFASLAICGLAAEASRPQRRAVRFWNVWRVLEGLG
jgi:hypothetical protein